MGILNNNFAGTLLSPVAMHTWNKLLQKANIPSSEIIVADCIGFYRELIKAVTEAGGIDARLGELWVSHGWTYTQGEIDEFFARLTASEDAMLYINKHWANNLFDSIKRKLSRIPQSVGEEHYNLPHEMYVGMLGESVKYTAPVSWHKLSPEEDPDTTLQNNQKVAMEHYCQAAQLEEGMRVLEVGFGNGSLMNHAIENHKVTFTGLTVSDGQKALAEEYLEYNENRDKTDLKNLDWKELYTNSRHSTLFEEKFKGKFDRIISIEMIEAVSTENLPLFFKFLYDCLNDDGLLFLQAINSDRLVHTTSGFLDRYIFPDGVIPQHLYMRECAERAGFKCEKSARDIATQAYDTALIVWYQNLEKWYQTIEDKKMKEELDYWYNNRTTNPFPYRNHASFLRIFEYYLKMCAGSFRSGYNKDGNYAFYKSGNSKTYDIIRPTQQEFEDILKIKHWGELPKST